MKDVKKYWEVYDQIIGGLEKKQKKEDAFWDKVHEEQMKKDKSKKRTREELLHKSEFDSRFGYDGVGHRTKVDYLSDEHIREAMLKEGYRKSHYERTQRKNSIRTNTYKLLKKARENIEAVEQGVFGIGHEQKSKV